MGDRSAIEWTDATWNPVTGCTEVSPGCDHCYARQFAERFRGVPGHPFAQGFDLRLWPDRLALPLTWRKPRRVFVNSMSDLFHQGVPNEYIERVWSTMAAAPQHTFQVLTKRPDRMRRMLGTQLAPLANVWLGTSVESEQYAWRIDKLRQTPAAVRFLSLEPLLGPLSALNLSGIHWVIVGGESGPFARPMAPSWAREIRDHCQSAGVPFFFKQAGAALAREWRCSSRKGSDPAEWPAEFRVRELPGDTLAGCEGR